MILSREEKQIFRSTFKYLKPYKGKIIILYLATIISNVCELLPIYFTGNIINNVVAKEFDKIIQCIIYLCLIFVLTIFFSCIETYLSSYLENKITYDIKNDMFHKIVELPINEYNQKGIGYFMSLIQGDSSMISSFYIDKVLEIIIAIITAIVSFLFMLKISITLSLVCILSIPIGYLGMLVFGKKLRMYTEKIRVLSDKFSLDLNEVLSFASEVKCLGMEKRMQKKFERYSDEFFGLNLKNSVLNMWCGVLNTTMSAISEWLIIGVGCYLIIIDKLQIGSYVSFNGYIQKFVGSVSSLFSSMIVFQTTAVSISRMNDLYQLESEDIESKEETNKLVLKGDIKVSNLKYKYEQANEYIIKNIDMIVRKNSLSVIVGINGSGKSTFFKLLERLYTYEEGCITIDGRNIKDISLFDLRNNISYVQQSPAIFSGTIGENLMQGRDDITIEEMDEACKKSGIYTYIMTLPEKYDTLVGQGGITLSGGEQQKLSIARALLRKTNIILMDECTSDLDGNAEQDIMKILHTLAKTHTILMISHRINSIVSADNIFMFKDGNIVAEGKHKELMETNDDYRELLNNQIFQE